MEIRCRQEGRALGRVSSCLWTEAFLPCPRVWGRGLRAPSAPGRALISSWAHPPQPPQACLPMPSPRGQGCNLQWGSPTFVPTVHTGKGSLPWKVSPHM